MEPSGPKESPAQSHGVCSALRDSGVSDRGLGGGEEEEEEEVQDWISVHLDQKV